MQRWEVTTKEPRDMVEKLRLVLLRRRKMVLVEDPYCVVSS